MEDSNKRLRTSVTEEEDRSVNSQITQLVTENKTRRKIPKRTSGEQYSGSDNDENGAEETDPAEEDHPQRNEENETSESEDDDPADSESEVETESEYDPVSLDDSDEDANDVREQSSSEPTDDDEGNCHFSDLINVSFYKINLSLFGEDCDPLKCIQSIIKKFNGDKNTENSQRKSKKGKYKKPPAYEIYTRKLPPAHLLKEGIHIYVQSLSTRSPASKMLDTHEFDKMHTNCVIFFHNIYSKLQPEMGPHLFAVTLNQGYRLILKYADSSFCENVAAYLFSVNGVLSYAERQLFGDKCSNKNEFSVETLPPAFNIGVVITEYSGHVRPDSSIYTLSCFEGFLNAKSRKKQSVAKKDSKKRLKVTISNHRVRFHFKFDSKDFENILSHLGKFGKQPMTTAGSGSKVEEECRVYRFLVTHANSDIQVKLNQHLSFYIRGALLGKSVPELKNFSLMDNRTKDFLTAGHMTMSAGKKNFQAPTPPSFQDIFKGLNKFKQQHILKPNCKVERAYNLLSQWKYTFPCDNGPDFDGRFVKMIQGHMSYEGETYWRYKGKWHYVLSQYIKHIHQTFVRLLKHHLILPHSDEDLPCVWKKDLAEADYNKRCGKEKDIIVGDTVGVGKDRIELFDVLRYGLESTYLYHVKKSFLAEGIRAVCSQLYNAAFILHNEISGNSKELDVLKKWFKKLKSICVPGKHDRVFSDFNNFRKLFDDVVFVASIRTSVKVGLRVQRTNMLNGNWDFGSLHLEKQLKTRVDVEDLKFAISALDDEEKILLLKLCGITEENDWLQKVADCIFNQLKEYEYIEPSGEVLCSLIVCQQKDFRINPAGNTCSETDTTKSLRLIYKSLLRPYRTYFGSLNAKLDIISMVTKMLQLGYMASQVKICEIRGAQT